MNSSILMLAIIIGILGLLQAIMDIITYLISPRGVWMTAVLTAILYVISSILSWYGILVNSNIIAKLGILIFFGNKLLCLYLLKKGESNE